MWIMNQLPENDEDLNLEINVVINKEFVSLAGFIISYDKENNYSSLFSKYLEIDLNDDKIAWYDNFITHAHSVFSKKKEKFLLLKEKVQSSEWEELWIKQWYILKNFESIELFFDLLELYIPIEAWKIHKFSEIDGWINEEYLSNVVKIEEEIFWKEIHKQPEFAHIALDEIKKHKDDPHQALSQEDSAFLDKVILTVESNIWKKVEDKTSTKETLNINDSFGNNSKLNNQILSKKISREKYCEIFQLAFEILWMPDKKVIIKEDVTNISVSYEWIIIPANDDYAYLTVERIISLIAHELERHSITNENNLNLIWNMKSLSYLWKEEWVAHVMEFLAKWYDVSEIPINRYLPRMLVWEILPWSEFKNFLRIMNKLDWESINVETFFNRFKRWKVYELAWVNPKEKLYWIWALETIKRIINPDLKEDPRDLFLAKNWYTEQAEIVEVSNKSEEELVFPVLLWELLRYKILDDWTIDKAKWLEVWWFLKFFWNKYWEVFDNLWLELKDLLSNHILANKNENKQKVDRILELLIED